MMRFVVAALVVSVVGTSPGQQKESANNAVERSPADRLRDNPNDTKALSAYASEVIKAVSYMKYTQPGEVTKKVDELETLLGRLSPDAQDAKELVSTIRRFLPKLRDDISAAKVPLADLEKRLLENPDNGAALNSFASKVLAEVYALIRSDPDEAQRRLDAAKDVLAKVGEAGRVDRTKLQLGSVNRRLAVLQDQLGGAKGATVEFTYDLVIYGGTSGGIAAAIQARRMGKTAVVIEPGKHLGGLTSGGLGATDIGNKAAIGGVSREFYQRIKKYYADPANWKHEKPESYKSGRNSEQAQEDAMWTFEPSVAERLFDEMCRGSGVVVIKQERLDLKNGVEKRDGRIVSIRMESGKTFRGRMFVDATYEGDLMAKAGVSYSVGREANAKYGETLNGVQTKNATKHQFVTGVDPYVKKGDKSSGLLPGLHDGGPSEEGSGDVRVQAYNFRMCLTDVKENQIPFTKPAGYDERDYELLLRNFEAGETRAPWNPILMPNRKTDANNNHGFSSDYIGQSYDWPSADHVAREKIFDKHLKYQQGLIWTLVSNRRVPEKIREEVSRWGLCKNEFHDFSGWPHQLYVREARRLVSDYVMTQHNCQGRAVAEDAVGLAAYTMDSHNVQRYVDSQGQVRNEGDVQVGGFSPYPISYRSLVPKESECQNLFVPVCLAATHIAYGSIRMEPVFMVLGQSSATAAAMAIDDGKTVQQVDYKRLREQMLADKQVLEWTGPRRAGSIDPKSLPGLVIDDDAAEKKGEWSGSASVGGFVGAMYLHDNNQSKGQLSATYRFTVSKPGSYDVRIIYTANPNRATNVPVMIHHADGQSKVLLNERKEPDIDKRSHSVGKFTFGRDAAVVISNEGTDGYVVIDAVQLVPL